jgi:hypothetical protein
VSAVSRRAAAHQARSHLTWEDVHAIRAKAKAGVKLEAIALEYAPAVHLTAVYDVVRARTWKDPAYTPGVERTCERPDCAAPFVTTKSNRAFCTRYCRTLHNNRLRRGYYARQEELRAQRRGWGGARLIAAAWSIDGQAGADGLPSGELEPYEALEHKRRLEVLAELDLEAVAAMPEDELAALRARLAREGFTPTARRTA